jgi:hypothetical protein
MLYLLVGFLLGTLVEYFIHRAVGHGPGSASSRCPMISRHSMSHHPVFTARRGVTCERGSARRAHIHLQWRAVFVLVGLSIIPSVGVALTALAAPVAQQATHAMILKITLWAGGGLVIAVFAYDLLHWLHHIELPGWMINLPAYKQARAWHHGHHEEPTSRFGVVLPLWDLVFRTHEALEDVERAPRAGQPAPEAQDARARSGQRRRPTTTVKAMLDKAVADAEADIADDGKKGKDRSGNRKKRPPTLVGAQPRTGASERKREGTGPQSKRPVADTGSHPKVEESKPRGRARVQAGTGGKAAAKRKGKSTAQWLAALDADAAKDLDIKITAVAVDDD